MQLGKPLVLTGKYQILAQLGKLVVMGNQGSDVIRKMVVEYGRIPNPYVIRKIAGAYTGILCPSRIGKTAGACAGILYSSTIRKASVYRRSQSRRILKAHSAVSKVQTSEEARKYYATKCSGDQARYKT